MQKPLVNKIFFMTSITALLCVQTHAAVTAQHKNSLKFDQVFSTNNEPKNIYYQANFAANDTQNHRLEVWREGQLHLRRKTDNAIDTYVIREAKNLSAYQMIIVDYQRRVTTKINRNNLIHLGNFSDWFDMAHGLRHPKGDYQLNVSNQPNQALKPYAACQWYALKQANITHHICWSKNDHIPLLIWDDQKSKVLWQVTSLNHKPIAKDTFKLHDAGFVRNDANDDIEND